MLCGYQGDGGLRGAIEHSGIAITNLEVEDEELWAKSADTPINRKWWDFMADIMETNEDNSPVCVDLKPVFYLQ